ncbi:MAG: TCP-1/cpn60 chaperonin family protein [Halobacteriales archaeon]
MGLFDAVRGLVGEAETDEADEVDRIALLKEIVVEDDEIDAEVSVTNPDELQQFLNEEEEQLREEVDTLADLSVDAVFVAGEVDELAQGFLEEANIVAGNGVAESDLAAVVDAAGGRIRSSPGALSEGDLARGTLIDAEEDGVFRIDHPETGDGVRIEVPTEQSTTDPSGPSTEDSDIDADTDITDPDQLEQFLESDDDTES